MLVLARGGALCPSVGFLDESLGPTVWYLQLFRKKKKMTNAQGKVGWARLELPEPLLTKQKVKMAGYWPSSSVRFYRPSRGQ